VTVYWRVLPEEYYRNATEVEMMQFEEEMRMFEMPRLFRQVSDLPTKELIKLHDALIVSMEEAQDPAVRSLLENILQSTRKEIEHRERSEGTPSTAWGF